MLAALPAIADPAVLVGATTGDDAAVYRIAEDRALVATVDFFTPVVDEPAQFGAIAAANAVSDVYAMGGKPLFALSILSFPREKLPGGALGVIVAAGAAKLAEAGCPVIGGHSIDDPEPKFGYAVTGEVDPRRMVTNAGGRPGDVLFLTKPLGSGLIATAIKRRRCPDAVAEEAVRVMSHLNREAAEAMLRCGVHCATDVTGYGLLGHLRNFRMGAEVRLGSVPVIAGTRELADEGLFPGGTERNHAELAGSVDWGGLDRVDQMLLCDAQTSGGLLVAIPPERAAEFEAALAASPWPAARIGRLSGDGVVRVRP